MRPIMKPRSHHTTPSLAVANYKTTALPDGTFLHTFTPKSTSTEYKFIVDDHTPRLEEGQLFSIAYKLIEGKYCVDTAFAAKASEVDPSESHRYARELV